MCACTSGLLDLPSRVELLLLLLVLREVARGRQREAALQLRHRCFDAVGGHVEHVVRGHEALALDLSLAARDGRVPVGEQLIRVLGRVHL